MLRFFTGAVIVAVCASAHARTPQDLKNELSGIMPQGKKVRVIWCLGPQSASTVYGVDSDDGVVREITPASAFPSSRTIVTAWLTRDGTRVVFMDLNSFRVYAINWDGTNLRQLSSNGCSGGTWQDPNGSTQWLLMGRNRYNIDDMTKTVALSSNDFFCEEKPVDLTNGISLDGQRIGGFICQSGGVSRPGIMAVPAGGSQVCASSCQGCNFVMRPNAGTAYQFGHFPDGHWFLCMHNASGAKTGEVGVASTVNAWAKANGVSNDGGEPRSLQFTNDPDYVVYWWTEWKVNPVLFRLSDLKWVGMQYDVEVTDQQNKQNSSDAVFMPAATPVTRLAIRPSLSRDDDGALYTLAGRYVGLSSDARARAGTHAFSAALHRGVLVRVGDGMKKEMPRQ